MLGERLISFVFVEFLDRLFRLCLFAVLGLVVISEFLDRIDGCRRRRRFRNDVLQFDLRHCGVGLIEDDGNALDAPNRVCLPLWEFYLNLEHHDLAIQDSLTR